MKTQMIKKLVAQDLYYALRSARGVLFLVFFAVFWMWIFSKLGKVNTQWLSNPDGAMVLSWLFDQKTAQALFVDRNPGFSIFYLVAINTAPLFVLFAASDQTANDIGSKYLRFLLPRCQRIEIYISRFLGCVLLVWAAYIIVSLIAALWVVLFNDANIGEIIIEWLWVVGSLMLYVLPFIAFMSLCSALVGSAGLSALLGLGFYLIVVIIIGVLGFRWQGAADLVAWILPNSIKPWVLLMDGWHLIKSAVVAAIYLLIYGGLGWYMFARRDI